MRGINWDKLTETYCTVEGMKFFSIELSLEDVELLKENANLKTDGDVRNTLQRYVKQLIDDLRAGQGDKDG